jgi:hypothetical protein
MQAIEAGGELMLTRYFIPMQFGIWIAMVVLVGWYFR